MPFACHSRAIHSGTPVHFLVRHAYVTGADGPYATLQRLLRAEEDEEPWASLYRTRSRPFPSPHTERSR